MCACVHSITLRKLLKPFTHTNGLAFQRSLYVCSFICITWPRHTHSQWRWWSQKLTHTTSNTRRNVSGSSIQFYCIAYCIHFCRDSHKPTWIYKWHRDTTDRDREIERIEKKQINTTICLHVAALKINHTHTCTEPDRFDQKSHIKKINTIFLSVFCVFWKKKIENEHGKMKERVCMCVCLLWILLLFFRPCIESKFYFFVSSLLEYYWASHKRISASNVCTTRGYFRFHCMHVFKANTAYIESKCMFVCVWIDLA